MSNFSYTSTAPEYNPALIGLVVLQSDETLEHDFQRLIPAHAIAQHVTRIPSASEVSSDTLAGMEGLIQDAANLLPRAAKFDAVGYGCTSASSVIGAGRVAELIGSACNTQNVTEPLSALIAACQALDLKRIAFLSPYVEEVSVTLRGAVGDAGIETPIFGSFNEAEEAKVVRIDRQSIIDAAVELGRNEQVEAVFLSCTNLKTLDVIGDIEAVIGKPVLSSNQVLAWHLCRLAGVELKHENMGRLLAV